MKTTTTSAIANRPHLIGLAALLLAAFAVAFITMFTLTLPAAPPNQPARSIPSRGVDPAVRNRRLLELNEGIKPSVAPVRVNRNQRLLELNEGIPPVVAAVRVDRNKRLLELNEGFQPSSKARNPRDQRLYELNR